MSASGIYPALREERGHRGLIYLDLLKFIEMIGRCQRKCYSVIEFRNTRQIQMTEIKKSKQYDLENRTFEFARNTRNFVRKIPRTISNIEDGKQVIRSSGSIGANYIEANESLSKKDFLMRIKICRKEAKESGYWLKLIYIGSNSELEQGRQKLFKESVELMLIFGSILKISK
jgi:four helix bundle protein